MKTLAYVAMVLGCAMFVVGCSEESKKKVTDSVKETKESASSAAKKAGEGVAAAGDKAQEAMASLGKDFTTATDKAKSAMEGVAGGSDLLKQVTDLFASAQKSLQGVSNGETAQKAAAQLGQLDGKLDGIKTLLKGMP